jgi:adenylate cyclase
LEYEFLGEQEVKNIAEPVPAYRVLSFPGAAAHRVVKAKKAVGRTWRNVFLAIAAVLVVGVAVAVWHFYFRPAPMEVALVDRMAFPLPDKPSIAVLPFVNMSGDPEQEYFSDGLTEEIITTLSKVSELFVVARQSTFSYKGKPVKIKQVAEELGVQYVLEGSVRKGKDRVRVTAQLIDALSGHHLWAEHYDRELKDILAVQSEITKKIITALEVKLTKGEQARLFAKGTDNVEAWALGAKAWNLAVKYSEENNAKAKELLERALKLDPDYAFLWTALSHTHFLDGRFRWTKSPAESYKRALECAKKALTINEEDPFAHAYIGTIYLLQRQHDKAIAEGKRAISIDPNYADGYAILAQIMHYSGRFEEALPLIEKGIRLSPRPRVFYPWTLGQINVMLGRHEEAIAIQKQVQERCRRGECPARFGKQTLIVSYMELGREEEARAQAEELFRINPRASLEGVPKGHPFRDPAHMERWIGALRKAGFPETPPLPLPDKPSIAVLPFANMSGDPEQEYFSDGITESIITALSNDPDLFVIASNSTFSYKGKPVKIQKVSKELGVRYVLEGSVQKSSDRLRITAQLVDAITGHHLWAEQYDRDPKDLFALQDEIILKILTALQVKLTAGEQARLRARGTNNLKAYLKYLKARHYFMHLNRDNNVMAQRVLKEVIALDPDYPDAYGFLGWTHLMDIYYKSTKSPGKSIEKAAELAQKALALDDTLPTNIQLLGYIYLMKRQHEKAIAEFERSVALNPNAAGAHAWLGIALNYVGRPQDAIASFKKAIRLNPIPETWYLQNLGRSYRMVGRYEDSIATYKKVFHRTPDNLFAHAGLTATYSVAGRLDEARAQAKEVLRVQPKFSAERYIKKFPFQDKAETERLIDALQKAGLN